MIYKYELKRAFKTPGFKFAVIIAMLISMADYFVRVVPMLIDNHKALLNFNNSYEILPLNSYEIWIGGSDTSIAVAFFLLVPLFAVIPYGNSYFKDMNFGMANFIRMKCSSRKYIHAKYLAAFVSGAVAVGIPLIVNFLICTMTMSTYNPFPDDGMNMMMPKSSMSSIFYKYPLFYLVISILMVMVYAGCMAVVAMCASIYTSRVYVVDIFPMLFSIAVISFGEIVENPSIMPMNFINPAYSYPRLVYFFVIAAFILIFTYINVVLLGNKQYEK